MSARIPTLKQRRSIRVICSNPECRHGNPKIYRVKSSRAGQTYPCPSCGTINRIPGAHSAAREPIPEIEPAVIEEQVVRFVNQFLKTLRPNAKYLFETAPGQHISSQHVARIFGTYVIKAGLTPKYSFHALRHGRAARLWSLYKNMILVRDALRQKTTAMAERYSHMDLDEMSRIRTELSRTGLQPSSVPEREAANG